MITDMICFMNLYDIYDIVLIVCSCTWLLNVSVKVSSSQICHRGQNLWPFACHEVDSARDSWTFCWRFGHWFVRNTTRCATGPGLVVALLGVWRAGKVSEKTVTRHRFGLFLESVKQESRDKMGQGTSMFFCKKVTEMVSSLSDITCGGRPMCRWSPVSHPSGFALC